MTMLRTSLGLSTLTLLVACGPAIETVADTEGDSEGSSSSGGVPDPTFPNPTQDPDTSVGSMDATGDPTTGTPPGTTTGPDDTTGGEVNLSCCEPHAKPTCDEPDVVDCVCKQSASCCALEWDEACVDLAQNDCGATCDGPGSTGDPGTTTGSMGDACTETVTFEMMPSDATLSGAWVLGMSMIGEGEISVIDQAAGNTDGSILFEPDIPCDDTWYIWVRYWEDGSDDSYYATLDGMPMPAAIFEGDCSGGGGGYDWAQLNWRDEADPPCVYIEDPWAPTWTAGTHAIEFSYRESLAMGRILITNDDTLVPPP